jgi:hypothetical protein
VLTTIPTYGTNTSNRQKHANSKKVKEKTPASYHSYRLDFEQTFRGVAARHLAIDAVIKVRMKRFTYSFGSFRSATSDQTYQKCQPQKLAVYTAEKERKKKAQNTDVPERVIVRGQVKPDQAQTHQCHFIHSTRNPNLHQEVSSASVAFMTASMAKRIRNQNTTIRTFCGETRTEMP